MRRPALFLPIATALFALGGLSSTAAASDEATAGEEEGPVEIVVKQKDGDADKTITVTDLDSDEPTVTVETEEEEKEPTKIIEIDGDDSRIVIVEKDSDDDDDDDDKEIIIIAADDDDDDDDHDHHRHHRHHHHRNPEIKWLGLQAGAIFSPTGSAGRASSGDGRLQSNQFKACAGRSNDALCGYVKGMDFKVQMFETHGTWTYPRFVGYFRTGFEQGRTIFEGRDQGFAVGDARRLDYTAIPLFLGGNVYLFDEFPVRPYGGLGFGFDILRLNYQREQAAQVVDASARIGFELHGGLEVRISNYISLNAEVMQRWSARRKMKNLPDYSNTGLSVLAGVTVGIPIRLDRRR